MAAQLQHNPFTNKVRLISRERQTCAVVVPNRYELNLKGRWPWLQKLLFIVLNKLKAYSYDAKVSYTTTDIDTTKILDALMRNQREVEMLYNRRAKYVVMGREAFAKFANAPEIRDYMRFEFQAPFGGPRGRTALGLECIVVPWIEGFFVLPDLEDK